MNVVAKSGWLRTLWAGLLSLLLPGLGQVYAGAWGLGLLLYLVALAFDVSLITLTRMMPPTGLVVAAFAIAVVLFRLALAIDAGRRIRSGSIVPGRPWYRSAWLAAIPMVAIGVAWQSTGADYYPPGWRSFHVSSGSNMPTLLVSDYVLADTHHRGSAPDYGDVVVFRHPKDPNVNYIKRVVGLPGDRVQMRDTILYLNGTPVPRESQGFHTMFSAPPAANSKLYRETLPNGRAYTILEQPGGVGQNTAEFTVPAGSFFVLGDNRGNSLDSRFEAVGYVPFANVIGKVRTIYWSSDPSRLLSRVH
jgi:signal peptidase I